MEKSESLLKGVKFNKKQVVGILILGIISFTALYMSLPFFHVKEIIVLGNSKIKSEEIFTKLNVLLEKNPYLVEKDKIKDIYISDPYVEKIEIKSKFPRTLIFNIEKRQAVATIKFSGGFIIIDENAVALETTQEMSKITKPLINGVSVKEVKLGEPLNLSNKEIIKTINDITDNIRSAKLINNISQIEIDKNHEIKLTTPQGITVLLGNGKNLNEKMLMLNQILIDLHEKKLYTGIIDMRYEGYPVYRRKM